jgi:hypothetical protein
MLDLHRSRLRLNIPFDCTGCSRVRALSKRYPAGQARAPHNSRPGSDRMRRRPNRRPAARRRGRARASHWWASARTPTSASRLGRNGLLRPTYLPGRGPRWRAGRLRSPAAPCCCSSSRPLVQVRRIAAPVAPVPPRVNRTASWSAMHTSPSPKTSSTPPAYRVPRRLPTRSNRALEPNEQRLQATTTPSIRMSRVGAAGRVDVAPIDGFDMAARADQRDAERSPRVVPSKTRGTPGAPARGSPDIRRSGRSFHDPPRPAAIRSRESS